MDSRVKDFESFGYGWLKEAGIDNPDLSKIEFGKGYSLFVEHFGGLDPLFGDGETDSWWVNDAELIEYLVTDVYHVEDKFIQYYKERDYIDEDMDDISVSDVISAVIDDFDITECLEAIGITIKDGNAICGITDEDYFKECMMALGEDYLELTEIIKLG